MLLFHIVYEVEAFAIGMIVNSVVERFSSCLLLLWLM